MLISGLLQDYVFDNAAYQEKLRRMDFQLEYPCFRAAIFWVDGDRHNHVLSGRLLKNAVTDVMPDVHIEYTVFEDALVFIFCMKDTSCDDPYFKEKIQAFVDHVRVASSMQLTVFLGHEVYSIRELPCSYRSALALYEKSLTDSGSSPLYMNELTLAGEGNTAYLEELYLMLGYLVSHKYVYACQVLTRVADVYYREQRPYNAVIRERISFFKKSYIQAVEAAVSNNQFAIEGYLELKKQLEDCKTVASISQIYHQIAVIAQEAVVNRKNGLYDLAARVKGYIDKNYKNPGLDITSISENLQLSQSYVSRIFKMVYHTTILNYITELRIEEAKRLLIGTNRVIREISFDVGYSVPVTFTRAFRKSCGISPESYRRNMDKRCIGGGD